MGRILFTYLFIALISLGTFAQEGQLTMTVNKMPVTVGERFKLTIALSGTTGSIVPPTFNGFTIHTGPIVSSQSSWGTGKGFSQTSSHSYYLIPEKAGTFSIPPARAQTKDGNLKSEELKVEVVKNNAGNSTGNANTPNSSTTKSTGDCFVRMYTNKEKAVVGEPIVITYWLYNRYPRFDLKQHEQLPQHSGFWKEDQLVENPQWGQKNERIDGKDFQKAHLATQVLIPQRSGNLKLGQYKAQVAVGSRRSFFMNRMELTSNNVSVDIAPLPGGKTNAFTGAVGNLSLSVNVDRKEVDVNEAINLTVSLNGKGNLALVNELELDLPDEFEVYDPKTKDNIKVSGGGMSGSRSFEYLIIPRYPGDYDIPPIEFQYYDYSKKKYITKESQALEIIVNGEAGAPADAGARVVRKEDVSSLGSDIRHIRSEGIALTPEGELFPGSWKHIGGVSIPFILLGLFLVYRKRQDTLDADVSGSLRRKAGKVASKQLKEAKAHLDAGQNREFYGSLYQAMNDYMSQKFSLPLADINKEKVIEAMSVAGLETSTTDSWSKVLGDCEMAAYAPSAVRSPGALFEEVSSLIQNIEKEL